MTTQILALVDRVLRSTARTTWATILVLVFGLTGHRFGAGRDPLTHGPAPEGRHHLHC